MSSNLKQRWLDALRSGKYTQLRCQLGWGYNRCGLGVLSDITQRQSYWVIMDIWPKTAGDKISQIMNANDYEGLSFPALAEMIESWPDDPADDPWDDTISPATVETPAKELVAV
jgi:hypothetical protein